MGNRLTPCRLFFGRMISGKRPGASCGGIEGALSQRHCEERRDEATPFFARRDGLLRGACHRARIRATRWLAMTLRERSASSLTPSPGRAKRQIRSARLTIFWHCGLPQISFRTGTEARLGNDLATVLAENRASKGSGNADSQRKVRSSRERGHCRRSRSDSGCVRAHPASWRASASYLPLRAGWALCAWALRGCERSSDPFSAAEQRTHYKEFSK
jgi:hypothetical protein